MTKPSAIAFALALLGGGCLQSPSPLRERTVCLSGVESLYPRYEGTQADNSCTTDDDCLLGGCSAEVCSASPGVVTTCEAISTPRGSLGCRGCGCVRGTCVWYR